MDTGISLEEWDVAFPDYMYFDLCEWVAEENMTKEEKKQNPDYKTAGGYLKEKGYEEAWRDAWDGAEDGEKVQTIGLPHFDADIFEEITGIDIRKERFDGNTLYDKKDGDTIDIDGKKVSKSTVKEALKKYFGEEDKK